MYLEAFRNAGRYTWFAVCRRVCSRLYVVTARMTFRVYRIG
jgi:hypothetical protein